MKIPDKIKIGGRQVNIEVVGDEIINAGGTFNDWFNRIQLNTQDSEDNPGRVEQDLLHEIVECINTRYELKLEHPVITIFSEVLYQVLVDNPLRFGEKEVTEFSAKLGNVPTPPLVEHDMPNYPGEAIRYDKK